MTISVEFSDELTTEQVVSAVGQLSNPHIVLWYVGSYGLKEAGVHFYRNFLISPSFEVNPTAKFWLVDLTAWGAFKNLNCSIRKNHSCCDVIEDFYDDRIKCIRSSKIFKNLQEISDKEVVGYFNKALRRDFIARLSQNFPPSNITIGDIFHKSCPLADQWRHYDTSHAYSIFQYLEGCLVVEEILQQCLQANSSEIQIVFALPNDELKYYRDEMGSFRDDIEFLVLNRFKNFDISSIHIRINFYSFKYGTRIDHRPYNTPGKVLRSKELFYSDVIHENLKEYYEDLQYASN